MKEIKGFESIKESFRTRQVKYGGYATLLTLALVIGLILVNLIMGSFPLQLDMTEGKLFSLSGQTIQVLEQIKSPVNIYGLWAAGQENVDVTEILDLYMARNRNIRYQAVDPDRNPGLLSKFDPDEQGIGPGSVIVEGAKGFRVISPYELYDINSVYNQLSITGIAVEHRLTSALIYVETGITPVIYEVVGHGENLLASLYIADMVERENYSLKQLNLIQSNIPADASALIINSPKTGISRPEADKILDYLEQGGRLLVLADYRTEDLSMLNEILSSYGIGLDYGIVIENHTSYSLGNVYLGISDMKNHDIVKPLHDKQTPVIMPFAMGVSETGIKRRTVEIIPLLASSGNSWLSSDIEAPPSYMLPSDKGGPITTAVAIVDTQFIQGDEKQARIVVIGSGAILHSITNFGQIPANLDFFMNSLTWLEDRPEALGVRSKSIFLMPLMMSGLKIGIFAGI
ncbi:MAG: GldG family protein, partial [Treponema sp.]|nr:GldG family protein [Treponema sp.]